MPAGEQLQLETLLHLCFGSPAAREAALQAQRHPARAADESAWVDPLTEAAWDHLCEDREAKRDVANVASAVGAARQP
jgi:hypothetical protein